MSTANTDDMSDADEEVPGADGNAPNQEEPNLDQDQSNLDPNNLPMAAATIYRRGRGGSQRVTQCATYRMFLQVYRHLPTIDPVANPSPVPPRKIQSLTPLRPAA